LQVSELKKKQEAQQQLLRQKQKSDEAAKRLQEDIQRIKSQKVFSPPQVSRMQLSFFFLLHIFLSFMQVQLQQKIKQESEQFRSWKAAREKEVLQVIFWQALVSCKLLSRAS
jgi:hypothetical protein